MENNEFQIISPIDSSVYGTLAYTSAADVQSMLQRAEQALAGWQQQSIETRAAYCLKMVDAFVSHSAKIAEELSWQMGRPIRYSPGEVAGFEERARYMVDIAERKLQDIQVDEQSGFKRFIRREPLGIVFTMAPWNYPYLTAVNTIIPAIMAGNVVIMKPSSQTPLTGNRIMDAFNQAGLPEGVFQNAFLTHEQSSSLITSGKLNHVAFTGSVAGGKNIEAATAGHFLSVGLELGGNDPAYVRADAILSQAVESLVDGAYFNSGQSCCGIERIYVHDQIYDAFVESFVDKVKQYKLGHPMDTATELGPVAKQSIIQCVAEHIDDATGKGATAAIAPDYFQEILSFENYIAPQVVINVNHDMHLMQQETFGPVVGIMKVDSDEQAVKLMNDSQYGLTASIWSTDVEAALKLGAELQTGTCFMNRCDYLDPALAWTGVKQTGRGCTLSEIGYEQLTRPKSYHFKLPVRNL